MSGSYHSQFDEYVKLQKKNAKSTNIFDMGLKNRTIIVRHGQKGKKLGSSQVLKNSANEAKMTFSSKLEAKLKANYVLVQRYPKKTNTNLQPRKFDDVLRDLNEKLPISGRKEMNNNHKNNNNKIRQRSQSSLTNGKFKFGKHRSKPEIANNIMQSKSHYPISPNIRQHFIVNHINSHNLQKHEFSLMDSASSSHNSDSSSGRIKKRKKKSSNPPKKAKKPIGPKHPKLRYRKSNGSTSEYSINSSDYYNNINIRKYKKKQNNKNKNKKNNKKNNKKKLQKNKNKKNKKQQIFEQEEFEEEEQQEEYSYEGDEDEESQELIVYENEHENEHENESPEEGEIINGKIISSNSSNISNKSNMGSSKHSSKSSNSSGRSSDSEYEMDYEKMAHIMYNSVNRDLPSDINSLDWKPIKKWIRFDSSIDTSASFSLAPMECRIAGSCHELLVIYMKSPNINNGNTILKRLLKLARDPEEDNSHHFHTERKVYQYLSKIAKCVNYSFNTRTQVCVWPVETIYFNYNNLGYKWATIQIPFLPNNPKNNINNNVFVKIEPNSGPPCVNDRIVSRYQHIFSSITRGLNLIRDWQGYCVNQEIFFKQCKLFKCNPNSAQNQIRIYTNNKNILNNLNILIIIDPVLTTYDAHYENNNPTDFGIKAMDEWLLTHNCKLSRCNYFYLKDEILFGLADPNQTFFDETIIPKWLLNRINKCRKELNIYNPNYCSDIKWTPPKDSSDDENYENKEDNSNNSLHEE